MIEDIFDEIRKWRNRLWRDLLFEELPIVRRIFSSTFLVDVSETENEIVIRADVSNFKKDEIEVYVDEEAVRIIGRKKESLEKRGERMWIAERSTNFASRVITLPTRVKPETAVAKYENGTLEIRVEKEEAKKGRKVKIE
ncbi:MAG: Hsp20/alpha crystallin family protein [Candidatus Aenigmatarchaeota archaeon]